MGFRAEDLTGRRYGRLVVLHRFTGPASDVKWVCQCDCGKTTNTFRTSLKKGTSQSCGCLRNEQSSERAKRSKFHLKHGMTKTPEYGIWCAMRNRCNNPKVDRYPVYGGRGIKVCERWSNFENFIADMGLRPSGKHSIDRRDNDGDYEPSNCYWATPEQQTYNKSTTLRFDYKGQRLTVKEASEKTGISRGTLMGRYQRGWTTAKIIETPKREWS